MKKMTVVLAMMAIILLPVLAQAHEREYLTVLRFGGTPGSYEIDLREARTRGNMTYIPVHQAMNEDQAGEMGLFIREKFEKENPGKKVTGWNAIYMTPISLGSPASGVNFVGINVTHEKRKK